jgi:hypothetical protein
VDQRRLKEQQARLTASRVSASHLARAAMHGPAPLSPTHVRRLQRAIGNQAVNRLLASAGAPVVQRFPVSAMKQGLGGELLAKHIGLPDMPDLSSREQQENALEAVYYHRPFERGVVNDRRPMNSVFFADPSVIFDDLKTKYANQELNNSSEYTTNNAYPAISAVRVFDEKSDTYKRAQLQYGPAKPVVKINKEHGLQAFNHLQKTDPQKLATDVDLTPG